jgi:hypothetical protein
MSVLACGGAIFFVTCAPVCYVSSVTNITQVLASAKSTTKRDILLLTVNDPKKTNGQWYAATCLVLEVLDEDAASLVQHRKPVAGDPDRR